MVTNQLVSMGFDPFWEMINALHESVVWWFLFPLKAVTILCFNTFMCTLINSSAPLNTFKLIILLDLNVYWILQSNLHFLHMPTHSKTHGARRGWARRGGETKWGYLRWSVHFHISTGRLETDGCYEKLSISHSNAQSGDA